MEIRDILNTLIKMLQTVFWETLFLQVDGYCIKTINTIDIIIYNIAVSFVVVN